MRGKVVLKPGMAADFVGESSDKAGNGRGLCTARRMGLYPGREEQK